MRLFTSTAALIFITLSASAFAQNTINLEQLHREVNTRQQLRNQPLVPLSNLSGGCSSVLFPANGIYDELEIASIQWLVDNVNGLRTHIWDLNGTGGMSLFLDYADPNAISTLVSGGGIDGLSDLALLQANLPLPPNAVSNVDSIAVIESVINSMLSTMDGYNVLLDNNASTQLVGYRLVNTGLNKINNCEEGFHLDDDPCTRFSQVVANGVASFTPSPPNHPNAQIGRSAGGRTTSCDCDPFGSDPCGQFSISWSGGFLDVDSASGFNGSYMVLARQWYSLTDARLSGPVPNGTDGKFHYITTLGPGGGIVDLSASQPIVPECVNGVVDTPAGWSIRWSQFGNDSDNDIRVIPMPYSTSGENPNNGDLAGCSHDLAGIDSAIQPDVGELDDGPVMAPGCDTVTDANPESDFPISYATGHKYEEVTDLRVAVPGPDWLLKRDYSSDPSALNSSTGMLMGNGWSADPFCHLVFDDQPGSSTVVTLVGYPQNSKTVFVRDGGAVSDENLFARWHTAGPTSQTLRRDRFRPDDSYVQPVPVWILEEPGKWQMVFYRDRGVHAYQPDGGAVQGPESLLGFPLMWTDTYGSNRFYQYWAEDFTGGVARLRNIYLNGTPNLNIADAIIQFDWELDNTHSHIQGMLDKVQVLRPTNVQGEYKTTQFVDYTYGTEAGGSMSDDVGTVQDLVLVQHAVLMDDTEGTAVDPMYSRWTHYRYHGGPPRIDPDERFEASGLLHQLKAIIQPEQIEFVAQQRVENGDFVSTPETAVALTAEWILTQPDEGVLGSWNSPEYLVFDMASKIIGYEIDGGSSNRVVSEFIQTACGCGGGSTQGQKIEYSYDFGYDWITTNEGRSVRESIFQWDSDTIVWDLYRIKYTDLEYLNSVPYTRYAVTEEPTGLQRKWITEYEYDSENNLSIHSMPSWHADSSYTDIFGSGLPPAITGTQSNGLRYKYEYTDENYLTRFYVWDSGIADFAVQRETEYTLAGKEWAVTAERAFRDYSNGTSQLEDLVETVEYEYDFYNSGDNLYGRFFTSSFTFGIGTAIAAISTHVEAELDVENGPNSPSIYSSYVVLDSQGQPAWSVREDGSMEYREFSSTTGQTTLLVKNADPLAPAGGDGIAFTHARFGGLASLTTTSAAWGLEDDGTGLLVPMIGGELQSHMKYDLLGRLVEATSPGDVVYATVRELREAPSRAGVLYPATISLPHDLGVSASSSRFDRPTVINWANAGESSIERASFTLDESASFYPLAATGPEYTLETDSSGFDQGMLSRSVIDHTLSGLVDTQRVWHDTYRNDSYLTNFEYDSLGRLSVKLDPVGTAMYYGYDVLDRMIEQRIGDELAPPSFDFDNAILVSELFYDADQSMGSPVQGVGNGLVTVQVAYTGEGEETRTTKNYFDNRDRLVGVANEELPTYSYQYDNLDRVIESTVHSSLDFGGGPRSSDDATDRGRFESSFYSQRGLAYLTKLSIDPSNQSSQSLRSDRWFDSRGRVIAVREPSSPMIKTVYDTHSRVVNGYTTDHGATTPGPGSYVDASSIDTDRVIEQTDHLYDDQNRLVRSTQSLRPHDALASVLGALDEFESVRTYMAYFFDDADRVIAIANYGTGDTVSDVPFATGISEPSFPDPENPAGLAGSGALVSLIEYNRRGIVQKSIDAAGTEIILLHDDLSRPIATVENAFNVDDTDISWDDASSEQLDHRWVVSGFDYASPEQDRVTSFVYNGNGSVVKRVAHYPKEFNSSTVEGVQITEYVYGTIAGLSSNTQDTLVASGSMLFSTLYPDELTGLPVRNTGASNYQQYSVEYACNRLGELRGQRDQNGTELVYERDGLGRVVASVADQIDTADDDTLNGGLDDNFVDDAILRIETAFDDLGRVEYSTSKDGKLPSSTIKNQVQFSYTPLWQNLEVKQAHDGEVDGMTSTTQTVSYDWDNDSASNLTRLASITYPAQDGGVDPTVVIEYGDVGSVDDIISRASRHLVETLGDNGSTHDPIVSYEFIGMGISAKTRYDAATGIELSRTFEADGNESSGAYPGFDRFGRVMQQLWVDSGFGIHPSVSDLPAFPPIIQKSYDYDGVHNRQEDLDQRPRARVVDRDLAFQYDSLHRLETVVRSGGNESYHWNLDTFGNWDQVIQDKNANGVFLASEDFVNYWSHNDANELTEYTMSRPISFPPGQLLYLVPDSFQYDDNGNMRRSDRSTIDPVRRIEYIYDGWNRLVRVQQVKNAVLTVSILENEYNGLGWRTIRRSDTSQASYDGIDESRLYYYSPSWQLLEEHVDSDNNGTANWVSQQFWGSRHLNDAVAKRINSDLSPSGPDYTNGVFFYLTDILYSPLAIVREDSTLVNRLFLGAYGQAEHHWPGDVDGDGAATSADFAMITNLSSKPGTPIADSTNYNVDAEYNRDGLIGNIDTSLYNEQGARGALPEGWIDTNEILYSGSTARATGDNSIGFAGAIFDPAIGMYQMRNRYYAPVWGRFINRDPLGYMDGQSIYQYVKSSPTVYIDHMGLNADDIDPRMAYQLAYLENARERGSIDSETADRLRGRIESRIEYMQAYNSGIYHHDGLNGATAAAMYVFGMRGEDSVVHINNVTNEQLIRGNSNIEENAIAEYGLDPGQSVLISADDPLGFSIRPGGTYNPYVYGNMSGMFSGKAYCNEEGEVVLDGEITILPDTYNFDPKKWGGGRSYPGEALTRVGTLLPGNHAFNIYVQGAIPYNQSPAVNSTAWTHFAYFGTYYGY